MLNDISTPVSGPNPLCPDKMSARARFEELGRTRAAGIGAEVTTGRGQLDTVQEECEGVAITKHISDVDVDERVAGNRDGVLVA